MLHKASLTKSKDHLKPEVKAPYWEYGGVFGGEPLRSDIKSSGKFAIFRRLKIDPETPPSPYL